MNSGVVPHQGHPMRFKYILTCVLVLVLTGCTGGDEFTDIKSFMAEIERKPKGSLKGYPNHRKPHKHH